MKELLASSCLVLVCQAVALGQTATSTSLIASPHPSTYGQPVSLTATVTDGATGKVTFYDGVTVLGIGTLSGGQANLSTVMLPSGNRTLRAYYQGDSTYAPSVSAGAAEIVTASASMGLDPPTIFHANTRASTIAACDFNGDSQLDFVTVSNQTAAVIVYLGNGDGTFQPGVAYGVTNAAFSVACADFNGDGKPDLVASGVSITVLLGNGDGTFQAPLNYPLATNTLAVADFNSDGKADLVALLGSSSTKVAVLLGNGDGTFQTPTLSPMGGVSAGLIVVGDFNEDGRPDLLLEPNYAVEMLAGNGDGTFQSPQVIPTNDPNLNIISMQTADLNGDGHTDIVVNSGTSVTTLIGNGNGTFGTPHPLAALDNSGVSIGDFNGDGVPDLAILTPITNLNYAVVAIAPGNADGTFGTFSYADLGPLGLFTVSVVGSPFLVGDFNGDGRTDFLFTGSDYSGYCYALLLGGGQPNAATLTPSSSHSDPVAIGQSGVTYTISIKNNGPGATSGKVTVIDTLPAGIAPTGMAGNGWTCIIAELTCVTTTSIPAGQSYSPITLTVNIGNSGTGATMNLVSTSGGGAVASNGVDPTTIVGPPITIQTNPAGLQFALDNRLAQKAPQTLNVAPGTHTISVMPMQTAPGAQYNFTSWSDSGAASHNIAVGTSSATYTATFQTQYQLTITTYPQSDGTLNVTSGTYYNAGATVTLTATPTPPLTFTGWSNGATTNPLQLTMNAPVSITANFDIPGATCTMTGDATASSSDVQFMVNEALGIVAANSDLTGDGVVNVADVQRVANAAMNLGCLH
jgi:uncharacterized repeat protein (TIGR01451 family)